MECKAPPPTPPLPAAAISAVLDDDDLLIEILVRVAFPTSLVRAALVCKRWYSHASAPAFLRRFRSLHPPRPLGFYMVTGVPKNTRFVPLPQPPELAAVVRRGSFDLDTLGSDRLVESCWNGILITASSVHRENPMTMRMAHCPLYPSRDMPILPPLPETTIHDGSILHYDPHFGGEIVPNGDSNGDGLSCFYLAIGHQKQQTVFDVYALQDGVWAISSSAVSEIPKIDLLFPDLLSDAKIYNVASVDGIDKLLVLDLVSSSLALVNLPEEVDLMCTQLLHAGGSGIHLAHIKGSELRIWLHTMDNNGVPFWFLVDTISLHEICVKHMIPTCMLKDDSTRVHSAGASSEFIFLEMDEVLYLFDIKHKVAKKVYEVTAEDRHLIYVIPFMMVWPPKFPVMKERCDPKE